MYETGKYFLFPLAHCCLQRAVQRARDELENSKLYFTSE